MDDTTSNLLGGSGAVATFLGVAFAVYKAVNHHRIRSSCCGRKIEVSVDVEETTPTTHAITIQKPEAKEAS